MRSRNASRRLWKIWTLRRRRRRHFLLLHAPCTLLIVFGGRRNGGGTEYAMRSDQGEREKERERAPLLPLIRLQCSGDAMPCHHDAAADMSKSTSARIKSAPNSPRLMRGSYLSGKLAFKRILIPRTMKRLTESMDGCRIKTLNSRDERWILVCRDDPKRGR